MPNISHTTPYQKIFTRKEELNEIMLKIIDLISYKKINLPFSMRGNNYIPLIIKDDALTHLFEDDPEFLDTKSIDFVKFQTPDQGKFLLNFFNLRISIAFEVRDLTEIFNLLFENNFIQSIPSGPSNNPRFLFCYLNLWPFERTWRLSINKGNFNLPHYNILAQDIIMDYFQTSTSTFLPKIDHRIL